MTDEPIPDAYNDLMNAVAGHLDDIFNGDTETSTFPGLPADRPKKGFMLFLFDMDCEPGDIVRLSYISNVDDRSQVAKAMQTWIDRQEAAAKGPIQ